MVKQWYLSKTLWLAVLMAVGGILTALLAENPILQNAGWVMVIKAAIDGLLRIVTVSEIK